MSLVRSDLGLNDDESEALEPPPALFWYPKEYVVDTWRQNQKHGTYPDGTYNLLDPMLRADWHVMTARYNYHFEQFRPAANQDGENSARPRKGDMLTSLLNEANGPPADVHTLYGD